MVIILIHQQAILVWILEEALERLQHRVEEWLVGLVASEECMVVIQVCNRDGKRFSLFNFNIIKNMQY